MEFIKNLYKGRINRKYFFLHYLLAFGVFCILVIIPSVYLDFSSHINSKSLFDSFASHGAGWAVYYATIMIAFLIYIYSLEYRRVQDLGYSGLFVLISVFSVFLSEVALPLGLVKFQFIGMLGVLLAIMSSLLSIVLFLFPGKPITTKYGAVPS